MNKEKTTRVLNYLEELFPDAYCELNHDSDFQLLVAVMLSAQTTDKKVNELTKDLFKKYPDVKTMSQASLIQLQEDIKTIGLYRNKAKNLLAMSKMLIEKYDGKVPSAQKELESLPGVGRKTANVVLSNAFGVPSIAVDTHVFRVSNRLGLADSDNVLEVEKQLQAELPKKEWSLTHHLLIFHGRRMCIARNPKCGECPFTNRCKYFKEQKAKKH